MAATTRARPRCPESGRIPLKQENIDFIKRAMVGVTTDQSGTGYKAFHGAGYVAGGKTGTAQVVGLKGAKYNRGMTPERLRDNALFIAFAPADKPKIALALVVENAGFGAPRGADRAQGARLLPAGQASRRQGQAGAESRSCRRKTWRPTKSPSVRTPACRSQPGGETPGNKE
jgi:penicillin-binding protein 2